MSKKKRRIVHSRYLVCLLFLSLLFAGSTIAGYVRSESGQDAARVAALGKLSITENGAPSEGQLNWELLPGVDLVKDVTVHFESKEVACYVFCRVEADGFQVNGKEYSYLGCLDFSIADGWECLETDGKTVYYTVAEPGEQIEQDVFGSGGQIQVGDTMTASQIAELQESGGVRIKAAAVQYGGFDGAASAYDAIKE